VAQDDIDERWHLYEQMASVERIAPAIDEPDEGHTNGHVSEAHHG
jgi:hypothetical protein